MTPTGRTRTVWQASEDATLLRCALAKTPIKWAEVAKALPGRTALQCRQRWLNSLDPTIKKGAWTGAEDARLGALHGTHGDSWSTICKEMPGRTSQQCRYRWVSALDPSLNLGAWTDGEDATLARLHAAHGNAWSRIAGQMRGRTDLQCRYRWVFCLDPSIGKAPWAPAEDRALLDLHRALGPAWAKIAHQIPGRTYHQCRYRAASLLGTTTRKRARTADADAPGTSAPLRMLSGNMPMDQGRMPFKKMVLKRWEAGKVAKVDAVPVKEGGAVESAG